MNTKRVPLVAVMIGVVLVGLLVWARVGRVTSQSTKPGMAQVSSVADGDTIDVTLDGHTERVRLLGIDTPETVDPRRPVGCFGPARHLGTT